MLNNQKTITNLLTDDNKQFQVKSTVDKKENEILIVKFISFVFFPRNCKVIKFSLFVSLGAS